LDHQGLQRPPAARLEAFVRQLAEAGANRTPRIAWAGGEIWVWRRQAWAIRPRAAIPADAAYAWTDRSRPLAVAHRELDPAELDALGISRQARGTLEIRFPRGGERLPPRAGARPEPLRELLRRGNVPPWERDRIPLVYLDGELVGAIGVGGPSAG
jgi:tRNA(Ile)-lysidine synthase